MTAPKETSELPADVAGQSLGAATWLGDDVPKHKKRSDRKLWTLEFEYHGDKSKLDRIQRMLVSNQRIKFATERAAKDLMESWKRGRGYTGTMCRPPMWSATIKSPSDKVSHDAPPQ